MSHLFSYSPFVYSLLFSFLFSCFPPIFFAYHFHTVCRFKSFLYTRQPPSLSPKCALIITSCPVSLFCYSVAVLCGELLREAEFLVNQRVHPMTIMAGWRQAVVIARQALDSAAVDNRFALSLLSYLPVPSHHFDTLLSFSLSLISSSRPLLSSFFLSFPSFFLSFPFIYFSFPSFFSFPSISFSSSFHFIYFSYLQC